MGVLDSLKSTLAKDGELRRNADAVAALVGDKTKGGLKGLGGLVDKLKASEIADQVGSWVSTNANKVVSAEQIQKVVGPDAIKRAADKLGVSAKEAGDRVAHALPVIIDNISPTGKLPENLDKVGTEIGKVLKDPKGRAIGAVAAVGVVGAAAGAVLAARAKNAKAKSTAKPKAAAKKPAAKPKAAAKPAAKKAAAKKAPAKKPATRTPAAKKN